MSADTRAALEAAIADHFTDELDQPVLVTDWVLSVAGRPLDADVCEYLHCSQGFPHALLGLLAAHHRVAAAGIERKP